MAVLLTNLMDRADIGMVESGGRLRLPLETSQCLGVSGDLVRQELQGNKTMESSVLSFVNNTHPPSAELLNDAVVRDGLADHAAGMLWRTRRQVNESGGVGGCKRGCWRNLHSAHDPFLAQLITTTTWQNQVCAASCDLHDKVALLEMGADDYMTKPFSLRELLARLRVALRHAKLPARASQVVFDGIVVDFGKIEVTRNSMPVELTAHEFKTLQFFIQNPDRVITRAELVKQVCGYGGGDTNTRSIDNHIMKLRHKLEQDPGCPTHFLTIPRLGYKFAF
jgi:DNA-binding winged helix-turn-helix (wHTH) protein